MRRASNPGKVGTAFLISLIVVPIGYWLVIVLWSVAYWMDLLFD